MDLEIKSNNLDGGSQPQLCEGGTFSILNKQRLHSKCRIRHKKQFCIFQKFYLIPPQNTPLGSSHISPDNSAAAGNISGIPSLELCCHFSHNFLL